MKVLSGSLETSNGAWLFRDLELSLVKGGWTCLLGPSGVCKTTVLRMLAGLEVHGRFAGELATLDAAYMAQQDLLMPWLDVAGNVTLGSKLRGEAGDRTKAMALIERVGLADHVHKFPRQLSGGMRQRAALARTLMEERSVVLLDEPFSALDARTRAEMQELAHHLLHDRTVLLVTHDPLEAARLGDQTLIMTEMMLANTQAKTTANILEAEASETLELQAQLLASLRGYPA
jgi:putative hydroxymethylpyrimidine transport system ATP-binding protein